MTTLTTGDRTDQTAAAVALGRRHEGETIVVLGSGPQLGELSDDDWAWIDAQTTIGLNRTMLVCSPTYLLSAYLQEVAMCAMVDPGIRTILMRSVHEPVPLADCLVVRRLVFDASIGLEPRFRAPVPVLRTSDNVAFGATHLAAVMGAARVVYVGCEQRNKVHFYDDHPDLLDLLRSMLHDVAERGLLSPDHENVTLRGLLSSLEVPADELRATPFYHYDHSPTFRQYFAELRRLGVTPVATTAESVVADAGAEVRSLAELAAGA